MRIREPSDFSDIVADLQLELQELKAKQFTGQDSGMLFKRTEGAPATFQTTANAYECFYINSTFTPSQGKPTINYPTFTLTADGIALTLELYKYANYIYEVTGGGTYWTLYHFFHQVNNQDGTITWQSVLYNDGASRTTTFHFTPIISASDSGVITNTVGRYY